MHVHGFHVEVHRVRFEPVGREVEVLAGTLLMDAVSEARLPLGQSCDGVAICGFCRLHVVAGADALSAVTDGERKVLSSLGAAPDERLACCARIEGDVTVRADYW